MVLEFNFLVAENTWSIRYNIPKNDRYSILSTDWTLVSLNVSVENYGIKIIYNQIDSPHADVRFDNLSIPRSVY